MSGTRGLGHGGRMGVHEKDFWLHMERNQRPLTLMFVLIKEPYEIEVRILCSG